MENVRYVVDKKGAICFIPKYERRRVVRKISPQQWHILTTLAGKLAVRREDVSHAVFGDTVRPLSNRQRASLSRSMKRLHDAGYIKRNVGNTWSLTNYGKKSLGEIKDEVGA
jgi:hypothetical protein